ncbi:MAG: 3-oxoacyl-ACP reductase [Ramlibacter sp.]|nr:3-oxoacyl-ACP reductase [Ramlibacter sp.]
MKLADRHLVVTGGASGIGRTTVEAFLREGARVAILDIDDQGMQDLHAPGRCWPIACDVRDEGSVQRGVQAAAEAMGGIDGVVNCAGVANGLPFEQTDWAAWKAQIDTNLGGTFLVCKAVLPWLRKVPAATIVNMASAQALLPTGSSASYTASKGGVVGFSKTIAIELAPKIRVNTVCPGTTRTPMVDKVRQENPAAVDRMVAAVPMGRLAETGEIVNLIVFLTSTESSFMTGTAIAADGGRTRH